MDIIRLSLRTSITSLSMKVNLHVAIHAPKTETSSRFICSKRPFPGSRVSSKEIAEILRIWISKLSLIPSNRYCPVKIRCL